MKVILQKDVVGIGLKGDVKNVADGYAQNFLLPKKLAIVATKISVAVVERTKLQKEAEKKIADDLLLKSLSDLNGKKVVIKSKASETGHLFKGIHKKEIAEVVKMPEDFIVLEHPIKQVGVHTIVVDSKISTVKFELLIEEE